MPIKLKFVATRLRFLVLCAALGCATATVSGIRQSVKITTHETTVPFERTVDLTSFGVTVVAMNEGPLPIYLSECMSEAQRLIGTQWITVNRPICTGVDSFSKIVRGDSVVFPMRILAYRIGAPALDPRMTAGEYRLAFMMGVGASPLDSLQNPSSFVTVTTPHFFVKE